MLEDYTWSHFQLFKGSILYHIFKGPVNMNVQGLLMLVTLTAEQLVPELKAFEFEVAIEKMKRHKLGV